MTTLDILNEVFRQVFGDSSLNIDREMSSDNIEEWDSLTHMILISAIEARFSVSFTGKELLKQRNVGDLADDIERKISA